MSSEQEYKADFSGQKAEKALEHALDIRKFEISLYWQRAAYFWALIAVTFAGYFAILSADHLSNKDYLAYIVGCIGILFTWAWFLVNRGSKFWQENWENHVDMLEDATIGPLYKTVLYRHQENRPLEKKIVGPMEVSVSKINQWVRGFTLFIWIVLILHALPDFDRTLPISWKHMVVGIITVTFAVLMFFFGKTHAGSYDHARRKRSTRIVG